MQVWGAGGAMLAYLLACPLGAGGAGFRGPGPAGMLALVLWWCVPCLLSALLLCLRCYALEICLISHFKGVLAGFSYSVWVCLALVVCVACGAFVCVSG